MSVTEPAAELRVVETVPKAVALAFLKGEAQENVFLISRIKDAGMENKRNPAHGDFLGVFDEDQSLRGLAFLGNSGTLVISVDEASVARMFVRPIADRGYRFSIFVSEDRAGRDFLQNYKRETGLAATLNRRQPFYVLTPKTLAKGLKDIDMEQASLDSIDELTELSCAMVCEDLKLDVNQVDRKRYRLRMTEKVMDGRAFLCRGEQGEPIFKCDLAVMGEDGGLLEGVFTPKTNRKKSVATRAIWTLSKDLFNRKTVPFIALHVDEKNKAARKVYENVGFEHRGDFRLALMPTVV